MKMFCVIPYFSHVGEIIVLDSVEKREKRGYLRKGFFGQNNPKLEEPDSKSIFIDENKIYRS